jgi:hypothetical protein
MMPVVPKGVNVPATTLAAGDELPPGARGSANAGKATVSKPNKAATQEDENEILLIEIPR